MSGSSEVGSTYDFYMKSRQRLAVAGFRLRKFVTHSDELRRLIQLSECQSGNGGALPDCAASDAAVRNGGAESRTHTEEDQSYAKTSFGVKVDEEQGVHKILGIE